MIIDPADILDARRILPIKSQCSHSAMEKIFPGCNLEPDWSVPQATYLAPLFAARLLSGARFELSPGGNDQYVQIISEGQNYALTADNFELAQLLAFDVIAGFFTPRGFTLESFRTNYDAMFQAITYMQARVAEAMQVKPDEARLLWIIPDKGACGYYRAQLPVEFIRAHYGILVDAQQHYNERSMAFYDACAFHRTPSAQLLAAIQRFKAENRIIIYDTDDDIFSIPEWSVMHQYFDKAALRRTAIAMQLSDIISVSTEHLRGAIANVNHVTPNMLITSTYSKSDDRDREVSKKLLYKQMKLDPRGRMCLRDIRNSTFSEMNNDRPINILWQGSNTHDGDLQQVVEPIKIILKRLGVAVRFTFFGYCPDDFLDVISSPGNSGLTYQVKDEYAQSIDFISAVDFTEFRNVLHKLKPDIGLCPIQDVDFNLAKSNLKALEYGAMGVAVICSDFGPYQFIDNNVNGLLVKPNDTAGWVTAMELLITNRSHRLHLGDSLYDTVNSLYSWETDSSNRRMWDAYFQDIYDRSLAARKRDTNGLQTNAGNQTQSPSVSR